MSTPYPLDIRTQSGGEYVYQVASSDPEPPINEPLTIEDGTTIERSAFGSGSGQNFDVRLSDGSTQLVMPTSPPP